MGLPLFVAPVESDLPTKIGDKSSATRRPRSSIRRRDLRDPNSRFRVRRAALLRDNFPTPGPEPVPQARYPWIESGHPPPPEAYRAPPSRTTTTPPGDAARPAPSAESTELREALGEMRRRGVDPREARIISIFGESFLDSLQQPQRRSAASPPPPAREPDNFIDWEYTQPDTDEFAPGDFAAERRRWHLAQLDRMSMPAPPVAARFDRSPEHSTSAGLSSRTNGRSQSSRQALNRGNRRLRVIGNSRRPTGLPAEHAGTDGLGDRNRSLSPDEDGVWDTLLTTLTPDPQPPSAGSSFASATASASASASQSQSAAASSRTSLTGPEAPEDTLEQPCESGLDNSDSEGQEENPFSFSRGWRSLPQAMEHWTMNYPSRHRRFVSDLDANDPSRISFVRADRSFGSRDDQEMRTRRRLELARHYRIATRDPTPLPELLDHIVRDSSEESRGAGGQGRPDADSAPSSTGQTPNDNGLDGLQMIMRNMARREDIPDEWWAGAGLSRNMPEEP
ncbi:hypothetical protein CPLU01_01858 [Colletotrichum plurivorum]|uniref:Uncharacterized protein n=1 Tax=Colletotrichum plurivorum TaxID=2175906 RepID=A0A8H6KYD8_9PEZI|nr:hypothetical protein CPLU01_01858 [Colletotrichum plurivorum]